MISCHIRQKPWLSLSRLSFTLIYSGYFTFILNITFFKKLIETLGGISEAPLVFLLSAPIIVFCILNAFFLLCAFRYIEKIIFIILLLITSLASYASYFYGVVFDVEMIVNIMETDSAEALSYYNLSLLIWFVLLGIFPSVLIYKTSIIYLSFARELKRTLCTLFISAFIVSSLALSFGKQYIFFGREHNSLHKSIVPIVYLINSFRYIYRTYFVATPEYVYLGRDAENLSKHIDNKRNLLIFVVGETARAQNYELNGYNRATNQYTKDLGVISFANVSSCGTSTAVSVPCIFSSLGRKDYSHNQAASRDNLLDVLGYAGIKSLWIDNNSGCKGVCARTESILIDPKTSKYSNGSTCVDEALLEKLDDRIDNMQGNDGVLVLHLIGSHGPAYYQRYPEKHKFFAPDCSTNDIRYCTNEDLVNAYDNTILYTDFVISQLIQILASKEDQWNTALVYVSDHGESLGENGLYLHGMPYSFAPEEQTKVPLLVWLSSSALKTRQIDDLCLKKNATNQEYSHDNIFHSVLGLMNVKTNIYQPELDIFRPCISSDALPGL